MKYLLWYVIKKLLKKMIYKLKTCYVNTAYRLYVLIFKNNTRREE